MIDPGNNSLERSRRWTFPATLFVSSLALYIFTLPATILPGDSGELIAASQTLSIAHPPGYPLYLMLGKVFASALAWGSVAYRYNLLSAIMAALTVSLLYLVLRELRVRAPVSLGIALAVATHQAFWLHATATEVYALSAFFTVALFYVGASSRRYGEKSFLLLAYLGGLAISHHLTLVYALTGALLLPLVLYRTIPRPRTILACTFLGLLGLSAWLYIPIRARLEPPFTWGATDTLDGFFSHITASRYSWRLKAFDFPSRAGDFLNFFRLIASDFGLPLIGLGALGAATGFRRFSVVAGALVLVILGAVHFAMYNIPDIEGHVLPTLIGIAVLAGIGVDGLLGGARAGSRVVSVIAITAVFAITISNVVRLSPRKDEWLAYDYARAIAGSARAACGPSPVVITATDLAGLSLAYLSYVEETDVMLYIQGVSHPSIIGSAETPRSIGEAIDIASRNFGRSRLCVIGGVETETLGSAASICGMVSVPDTRAEECPSPYDYTVRGVGADHRDFFSRALSAEYYLHLAKWHARRQEQTRSIQCIESATGLARGDAQTYVDASRLYMELGHGEEAERLLRQAVEAEPTHFFAHFALANVLQMDGRLDEALKEYRLALRGNPQPAPAHVNMGNIHLNQGRHAEAIEIYGEALELEKANAGALLGMAGALESAGRPQEAITYLDRAIQADPAQAAAYRAKASLLMMTDRTREARGILRKGLSLSPDDPLLLSDMGLYFLRSQRPDSAIAYLKSALHIQPELLAARGNLAVAYERSGMIQAAMEQYRKYAEQAPPGPAREMAEHALSDLLRETED